MDGLSLVGTVHLKIKGFDDFKNKLREVTNECRKYNKIAVLKCFEEVDVNGEKVDCLNFEYYEERDE